MKSNSAREKALFSPERVLPDLARIIGPADPIYPVIGQKHLAPALFRAAVGEGVSFPRRYLVARTLKPEHFDTLPDAFVLKPSYGSSANEIVTDKTSLNIDGIFNDPEADAWIMAKWDQRTPMYIGY